MGIKITKRKFCKICGEEKMVDTLCCEGDEIIDDEC